MEPSPNFKDFLGVVTVLVCFAIAIKFESCSREPESGFPAGSEKMLSYDVNAR